MRIELTASGVEGLRDRCEYDGLSKPLSQVRSRDQAQSPAWWMSAPKPEKIEGRHRAAVALYLDLAAHATPLLVGGQFPAVLVTTDGKRYRPDKGVIKAIAEHLEVLSTAGELVFAADAELQRHPTGVS
jgi:hypothetical protein